MKVLESFENIFGYHFLEASAGTGKTFAIEQIFVRLLIESEEELSIDQILVVTFTKAATHELKLRIYNNIEKILAILEENQSFLHFKYLEKCLDQKEKIIRRLKRALVSFENAEIYTIHSFCSKILMENVFVAKVCCEMEKFETLPAKIFDYLSFSIDERKILPAQLEILLNEYKSLENLKKDLLDHFLKSFKKIKNFQSFASNLFQDFLDEIRKFDQIVLKEFLKDDITNLTSNYKKAFSYDISDFYEEVNLFIKFIEDEKFQNLENFNKIIEYKNSFFDLIDEKNKKKRVKDLKINNLDLLKFLKNKIYPIILKSKNIEIIFKTLLVDFSKRFENEFNDEIFSYDEILHKTKKALESEDFVKKVREKYSAVFIDEFQDTDFLQLDIFKKLFLEQKYLKALYLIGDPKQSIYSFRGADINSYLMAKDLLKMERISTLDTNFRTNKKLVNSLNFLFSLNENKWLKILQKDFFSVKSHIDEESFDDGKNDLILMMLDKKNCENKMFSYIVDEILLLREKYSLKFSSFAILVKDKFQQRNLLNFLENRKISANAKSTKYLADSEVLNHLKDLFSAIKNCHNERKIKKVLISPFFGYEENDLENELNEGFFKYFLLLKKEFENFQNFSKFLQILFSTKLFDDNYFLKNLLKNRKISIFQECLQLLEYFLDESAGEKISFDKIFEIFDFLKEKSSFDDERLKVRNFKTLDGVWVMTTHMSKGLEFDVVFAIGVGSRLSFFNKRDKILKDEKYLDDLDFEKLRQFYVALTRAKKRVYFPVFTETAKKNLEKPKASASELFVASLINEKNDVYEIIKNLDKKKIFELFEKHLDKISLVDLDILKPKGLENKSVLECDGLKIYKDLKPIEKLKKILSFSSLPKDKKDVKLLYEKKVLNKLPSSAKMGVFLHTIFEEFFRKKILSEAELEKIVKIQSKLHSHNELEEEIYSLVHKTLTKKILVDEKPFCLMDISPTKVLIESEFFYSLEKENFMKGFIDLIFEYNNKFYIVDWKSNFLKEGYFRENIEKVMVENNYYLQAQIYTEALEKYFKNFENLKFSKNFGGIFYVFLRGVDEDGFFHFFPKNNFEILEKKLKICLDI